MKKIAGYLIYMLLWLLYFELARVIFFFFNTSDKGFEGVSQLFSATYHGFLLDSSAIAYLVLLPFLLLSCTFIWPKISIKSLNIYHLITLTFTTFLIVADAVLYQEWGYKIEMDVFQFLKQPQGAIDSISKIKLAGLLGLVAAIIFLFYWLWTKIVKYSFSNNKKSIALAIVGVVLTAALIIPIRGGTGNTPLSIASAYYSNNSFSNHLAYNTLWNFGFSYTGNNSKIEKWKIATEKELLQFETYNTKGTNSITQIEFKKQPNVIYIALESFTAGATGFFGGQKGYTPNLDNLAQNGVAFSNCYSSGDRSDEGLASLYTGFPGFPGGSILEIPAKAAQLPNIIKVLKNHSYSSAFVCGSDLNFANIRTVLLNGEIDYIIENKDYKKETPSGKWGVHDGPMYARAFSTIQSLKQPYFCGVYSISSHAPYEVPVNYGYSGNQADFFNAIHYADSCLGVFIDNLKQHDLWENTLIVITADHGIRAPNNCEVNSPEKYHIPLVFTGGAIKKHQLIKQITSHTDIPVGVLALLGYNKESQAFIFSKNPFIENKKAWSCFLYTEGVGVITATDTAVYDLKLESSIKKYKYSDESLAKAKAYIHTMALYLESLN